MKKASLLSLPYLKEKSVCTGDNLFLIISLVRETLNKITLRAWCGVYTAVGYKGVRLDSCFKKLLINQLWCESGLCLEKNCLPHNCRGYEFQGPNVGPTLVVSDSSNCKRGWPGDLQYGSMRKLVNPLRETKQSFKKKKTFQGSGSQSPNYVVHNLTSMCSLKKS